MKREQILASVFLGLIGVFGIFLGSRYLLGFESIHSGGGVSCRAICGLGLLATEFFGESVAKLLTGMLMLLSGAWLTYFCYQVFSGKRSRK